MQFELSEEHQMIVDTVASFTERELIPYEEEVERSGRVSPELVQQIDPADRPRIFERFFRSPTATGVQGSGVGLAIVDQLVRAHGGEVGLSAAERGTTIEVRIPTRAGAPIVRG